MVLTRKDYRPKRRALLDEAKKEEMLAILLRNKTAYMQVKDVLTPKEVNFISPGHAALWRCVQDYYQRYEHLPNKGSLMAELRQAMADNPDLLAEEEAEEVENFIKYAFNDKAHGTNIGKSSTHRQVAMDVCKQFLEEYHAHRYYSELYQDGTISIDLAAELGRKRDELTMVSSLTDIQLDVPFPEGWDRVKLPNLFSTGVDVFDEMFGGGWCAPEVVLFMGPFGSCKTVLVCHAVSELVRQAALDWTRRKRKNKKAKRPVVFLVFTEGTDRTYQDRILSHMARVPWKKLRQMRSLDQLSDSTTPGSVSPANCPLGIGTAYELVEFRDEIDKNTPFESERQRVINATRAFNRHLVLLNCTANGPYNIGKGGIPEIANIIKAHLRRHNDCKALCLWLDHVSALAARITAGMEADQYAIREVIKRIPMQCVDLICNPLKVPMGIVHQLGTDANSRGSGADMKNTDAAECRSIAEFVDFAVVTAKPDAAQLAKFESTKHRREPPRPCQVVEIQGEFNRLRMRPDYVIERSTRQARKRAPDAHRANEEQAFAEPQSRSRKRRAPAYRPRADETVD